MSDSLVLGRLRHSLQPLLTHATVGHATRVLIADDHSLAQFTAVSSTPLIEQLNVRHYLRLSLLMRSSNSTMKLFAERSTFQVILMLTVTQLVDTEQQEVMKILNTIPHNSLLAVVLNHFCRSYTKKELTFIKEVCKICKTEALIKKPIVHDALLVPEPGLLIMSPVPNFKLIAALISFAVLGKDYSVGKTSNDLIVNYCQTVSRLICEAIPYLGADYQVSKIVTQQSDHPYLRLMRDCILSETKGNEVPGKKKKASSLILLDRTFSLFTPLRHATRYNAFAMDEAAANNPFNSQHELCREEVAIKDRQLRDIIPELSETTLTLTKQPHSLGRFDSAERIENHKKFIKDRLFPKLESYYLPLIDLEERISKGDAPEHLLIRDVVHFIQEARKNSSSGWSVEDGWRLAALLALKSKVAIEKLPQALCESSQEKDILRKKMDQICGCEKRRTTSNQTVVELISRLLNDNQQPAGFEVANVTSSALERRKDEDTIILFMLGGISANEVTEIRAIFGQLSRPIVLMSDSIISPVHLINLV